MDSLTINNENAVEQVLKAESPDELKDMVQLFNIAQTKKNVIRAHKLGELYDGVTDKIAERVEKRADEISTKELVDIFNATQKARDSLDKTLGAVDEMPTIQLNQQNINISVDKEDELSRDSKIKVMEAVKAFLDSQKDNNDMEIVEEEDETSNN